MLSFIEILVTIQAVFVFLFAGYEYVTLWNFPSLPATTTLANPPLVSIILPIRNQAQTLKECLDSIVSLDYPNKEVIVVEGNSTDDTRQLLQQYGAKVKVVEEEPLPPRWVGKNWACHLGYKQAQGEILLFTDGDSIHATDSLTKTVGFLRSENADLVTLAPGPILKSFWERVLQPPIFLLIMLFVGGKLVNDDKRRNALGNGQYMLFGRSAYERIGGHFAVRERITEDYSLARRLKAVGLRLRMVKASGALGVRMYGSLGEIWTGWRKNFYTVSQSRSLPKAVMFLTLIFAVLFLPFVVFGFGVLLGVTTPINIYLLGGVFMVGLLWLGITILDRSIGLSPLYGLLFPIAMLVYTGIGIDSTVRGAFGLGFTWKGRTYGRSNETLVQT